MTGFLYLSARVHSLLHSDLALTLSPGHDEQHALAAPQRFDELFVPIDAGLQATSVEPDVDRGGPAAS